MTDIDIAMTSVIRPSLLEETMTYIKNNVYDKRFNFRLIINVDPVGEDKDPMDVVKTAKKFFDKVMYNIPEEPSFPKAVKWVWSKTTAPYVFHWEDDSFIWRKIEVENMVYILNRHNQ